MCGIVGFVDYNKNLTTKTLDDLIVSILHRGPDDTGKCFEVNDDYNLGIGHTRLSIIDPSKKGNQPMYHNNMVISYNGEVYNFKSIRNELINEGYIFETNTDTEVVLKSFDFWGLKFVEKFNGIFAISIFDKKTQKIYLLRDRLGVKPLYWHFDNNFFLFSSELKVFKKINNIKKKISNTGLKCFLKYGYIPEPYSILENVFKLEAGSIGEFSLIDKKMNIKKYWNINFNLDDVNKVKNEKKILNNLDDLITESVKLRMTSDFPVGIFLSGGVDSSLITSYMSELSNEPINSFTIGFKNKLFDESNHATSISKLLKTNHHEFILDESSIYDILINYHDLYDEPFGDISILPMAFLSKKTKKTVKVVLSADGGDELFFGYDKYRKILNRKKKSDLIPKFIKNLFKKNQNLFGIGENKNFDYIKNQRLIDWLKSESEMTNSVEITKLLKSDTQIKTNFDMIFKNNDSFNEMLFLDLKTFLLDDILWKVDRSSMLSGLEARDPLLDFKLVEYSLKIPENIKFKNTSLKYLLKQLAYRKLPKQLIDRPKKGFDLSVVELTLKLLKNLGNILLNREIIDNQNLFNFDKITSLREEINNKKYHNIGQMWLILIFQIWYFRFMNLRMN